ncbi:4Fe-4S dicluster domain-containing protein [Treponema brennaborense]|uniref:4Fe-4S ferredoxin iron-sulfur binding domain-containing protein n=1 Tax=Treponema brennaborense (strain DSM 12168 / CIP 105900 / DD5/3) TaxID=906968 RepID=F4LQ97_TREBD|nr:4Fe-4S dicluster domain-containing protein [Treponema brennaborense]AEE16118.1 4Fe-4S ferredoxin iron-sulfur binding domain-containing protein [Treponema brennaborense DSM 12168]
MKRVYVNEKWCLGCHLCEYYCAFANSGETDMVAALKGKKIYPRIQVEGNNDVSFAVSCRHCEQPLCVKACIAGALSVVDGVIVRDALKCVGCHTCILSCPYGCIVPAPDDGSGHSVVQKCELCTSNRAGKPACVEGCPNRAIVFEDRGVSGYGVCERGAAGNAPAAGGCK